MQILVLGREDGGHRFALGIEEEDSVEIRLSSDGQLLVPLVR